MLLHLKYRGNYVAGDVIFHNDRNSFSICRPKSRPDQEPKRHTSLELIGARVDKYYQSRRKCVGFARLVIST